MANFSDACANEYFGDASRDSYQRRGVVRLREAICITQETGSRGEDYAQLTPLFNSYSSLLLTVPSPIGWGKVMLRPLRIAHRSLFGLRSF